MPHVIARRRGRVRYQRVNRRRSAAPAARFGGDAAKAKATYVGMTPLTAEDVAECVAWAVTRPSHVNVDTLVVLATDQADATTVYRRT